MNNLAVKKILKIAISGGIGSGKSYVCKQIEAYGYPIFYCDDEAKRIIRNDKEVQQELIALVGDDVYDKHGQLNKPVLAGFICRGNDYANKVDQIVHPHVGKAFLAWSQQQKSDKVFMECALLFEAKFDQYVDFTIHVAAPLEVRIKRVMRRDNVTHEKVLEWMNLQLPEEEKAARSNFIINNDEQQELIPQIERILHL